MRSSQGLMSMRSSSGSALIQRTVAGVSSNSGMPSPARAPPPAPPGCGSQRPSARAAGVVSPTVGSRRARGARRLDGGKGAAPADIGEDDLALAAVAGQQAHMLAGDELAEMRLLEAHIGR